MVNFGKFPTILKFVKMLFRKIVLPFCSLHSAKSFSLQIEIIVVWRQRTHPLHNNYVARPPLSQAELQFSRNKQRKNQKIQRNFSLNSNQTFRRFFISPASHPKTCRWRKLYAILELLFETYLSLAHSVPLPPSSHPNGRAVRFFAHSMWNLKM